VEVAYRLEEAFRLVHPFHQQEEKLVVDDKQVEMHHQGYMLMVVKEKALAWGYMLED